MPRRLRSIAVALGLAWLVLAWGLVMLGRVFVHERDDALASLAARREALAVYGERALSERLLAALRDAEERLAIASTDPLQPANDLLLIEDGETRLPRAVEPRDGDGTPGASLAARIAAGDVEIPDGAAEGDPWTERLRIARAFVAGVRLDDRSQIEERFRALLAHQARYRIDAALDLPSRLGLIELLARDSHPDPDLLRALVRDGLNDASGNHLDGLERALLANRNRFTAPDFAILADRLVALAEAAAVPYEDFFARVAEPRGSPPSVPPGIAGPTLLGERSWLVRASGPGRVEGTRVDLDGAVRAVLDEMRGRGLVRDTARLALPPSSSQPLRIDQLTLAVESPEWSVTARAVLDRFRLKLALLAGSGLVALALAGLAFAFQRQGRRIVELQAAFVGAVSHELRTPLASIRLLAETLERRLADEPAAKDYPARIVRAADGLSFLVENLLSVQRLDGGRGARSKASVALRELAARVILDAAQSVGVEVRADLGSLDGQTVAADARLLEILLANLVRNACLYNERAPVEVRVALDRTAAGARIRVQDNGVGLSDVDRPRVFQDFFRGTAAAARSVPGTGLGLALCRRIAALHGGTIDILASDASGTTFEVVLPDA